MKQFPAILHAKNKAKLKDAYYKRTLCYLRRNIYEHILKHEEKDYFDIDGFNKIYVGNMEMMNKLIGVIIEELNKLEWNTKIAFGGTGLFIYSGETPPNTYWG